MVESGGILAIWTQFTCEINTDSLDCNLIGSFMRQWRREGEKTREETEDANAYKPTESKPHNSHDQKKFHDFISNENL